MNTALHTLAFVLGLTLVAAGGCISKAPTPGPPPAPTVDTNSPVPTIPSLGSRLPADAWPSPRSFPVVGDGCIGPVMGLDAADGPFWLRATDEGDPKVCAVYADALAFRTPEGGRVQMTEPEILGLEGARLTDVALDLYRMVSLPSGWHAAILRERADEPGVVTLLVKAEF